MEKEIQIKREQYKGAAERSCSRRRQECRTNHYENGGR